MNKFVMRYRVSATPPEDEVARLEALPGFLVLKRSMPRIWLVSYKGSLEELQRLCPDWGIGINQQYQLAGSHVNAGT